MDLTKNEKEEKCRSAPESPADCNPAQLLKYNGHQSNLNHYTAVTIATSLNRGLDSIHTATFGDQHYYNRSQNSPIRQQQRRRQSKSVECNLSEDKYHPQDFGGLSQPFEHRPQPTYNYYHSRGDRRSAPTPRRSRSRPILEEEDYSDEESREMATLRRAESERRGSTPNFR